MSQKFLCAWLLAAVFCLTACVPRSVYSPQCRQLMLQHQLSEVLAAKGIQVVKAGDEVTLILPADKFFYAGSNHLRNTRQLEDIIQFLNAYSTEDMTVSGYTGNRGNQTRNLALSRAQAEAVSAYLGKHGLNTRLISAAGYGCHHAYDFAHIEIFFRKPPPDNIFH